MDDHLNVLVLESERGAAEPVRAELRAAGHAVLRCHEPGSPAFPCNALASGRRCPFTSHDVDVALVVRTRPRAQPAPQEDGVTCAIRNHVPLVVVGPRVLDPFEPYAAQVIDRTDDVLDTCTHAARAPLHAHTEAAARALRHVLDTRGLNASPLVQVVRRHGSLVVRVSNALGLDHAVRSMAAVRMIGAVRAVDSVASGIDVVFEPS